MVTLIYHLTLAAPPPLAGLAGRTLAAPPPLPALTFGAPAAGALTFGAPPPPSSLTFGAPAGGRTFPYPIFPPAGGGICALNTSLLLSSEVELEVKS